VKNHCDFFLADLREKEEEEEEEEEEEKKKQKMTFPLLPPPLIW